ncbi:MAG: peptide-methionine (S)-S-oxide reductase MsrA [Bacteroidetes bacterium]|nr:peptide-methionine (S)-S-oxide reductase MsrA [Bacteroidota bacterium]
MKKLFLLLVVVSSSNAFTSCAQKRTDYAESKLNQQQKTLQTTKNMDTATFGAGCFWCVEAQFQLLDGVLSVRSGFEGGTIKNPSYKDVCTGTTGHAEVCEIAYDPAKITYDELLAAFWKSHDPTQLNRQGNDIGTQYRSVIFYHNNEQKELAEKYKKELSASGAWDKSVVTEISPATTFYPAENYHQNYFNQNGSESYCQFVIQPKVEKFKKVFKDKLKN